MEQNLNNLYSLDGRLPIAKAVPFGLQHVLAMFVSNITPLMILANVIGLEQGISSVLIQNCMIIAGIGTLVQLYPIWRIGSRLPIVMGISFTFLSVSIGIASTQGMGTLIGAVIIGGLIEGTLGLFVKYWVKLIPHVVAATVVTAIGFSLLPIGANSFAGGQGAADFGSTNNWIVGSVTLLVCLICQIRAKGLVRSPFTPEFNIGAILSVAAIYLVSATETIGDTSALCNGALKRNPHKVELGASVSCDGFISSIAGLFGCTPITSFSQNVGLASMSGVVNRFTIATGAVIMILGGIFPGIGYLLTTIPQAVLGGCTIMMFGSILFAGFGMMARCGFSQRNMVIVSLSLSIGLGFTQATGMFNSFPDIIKTIFAENCVAIVFLLAVLLNLILPKEEESSKENSKL